MRSGFSRALHGSACNKVSAVFWLLIFFCSAAVLQAQQLHTEYSEIRLSDKRVLVHARVESFDGISFCIAHDSGIEAAVRWDVMPSVWQTAFPRDPELKVRLAETARAIEAKDPQKTREFSKPQVSGQSRPSTARASVASQPGAVATDHKASEAQIAYAAGAEERARQGTFDRAADKKTLVLGMNAEQCTKAWGAPESITQTVSASGTTQSWHYGDSYLSLDKGVLTYMSASVAPPATSPQPLHRSW